MAGGSMAGSGSRSVRRRTTVGLYALVGIVLVAGACAVPSGSTPQSRGAHFELPEIPFPAARSFELDADALDQLACAECDQAAAEGREPDDALFFYGDLPLEAVDALHAGSSPDAPLGHMFLSGYFGGLYLRDNLASIGAGGPGVSDPFAAAVQSYVGGATFGALDSAIGSLLRTARSGSAAEVRTLSAVLAPLMATVHGYNRGYLQVAIENPPPGAAVPDPLSCDFFFSCRTSALPMDALVDLGPVAAELDAPTDPVRRLISSLLHDVGGGAVDGGRDVWEGLLGDADFDADAYDPIVELSYGFLQVTEVALLGVFEGASGDTVAGTAAGRSGIVASAALLLWAGSYFLGLAADVPAGGGSAELPRLTCAD